MPAQDIKRNFYLNADSAIDVGITMGKTFIQNNYSDRLIASGFTDQISTTESTVWSDTNSAWIPPETASPIEVTGLDANDTFGGTGGNTIRLSGLDENLMSVYEDVQLNGTTTVTTNTSFLRLNSGVLTSTGNNNKLVANIELVHQASNNTFGKIREDFGRTAQAIYTTSADRILLLTDIQFQVGKGADSIFKLYTGAVGSPKLVQYAVEIFQSTSTVEFRIPVPVRPGQDIYVNSVGSSNAAVSVSSTIGGILYKYEDGMA